MKQFFITTAALSSLIALAGTAQAGQYDTYASQAQTYIAQGQTTDYNPHTRCKKGENRRQILGGALGAAAGAFAGSKIAADNTKTEGAVIGGLLGGAAGFGIADKTIDCDPVYQSAPAPAAYQQPATTYASQPAYTTSTYSSTAVQPVSYQSTTYSSGPSYPSRTIVSDHPVYSNPGYGARPAYQTYSAPAQTTTTSHYSQPRVVQTSYAAPVTTYSAPTTTYSSQTCVSAPRPHYHGKYACTGAH